MKTQSWRSAFCAAAAALALGGVPFTGAAAQAAFPVKPMTLVVPFPAGGAVDTLGRLFAEHISAQTGQAVIVENRGGANGNIGTEVVVKAPADGYTMLLAANGLATNSSIYPNRSFNELRDLSPVAYVGYAPLIMVVAQGSELKSFQDVIDKAKADPHAISFASAGTGSAPHLASELLKLTTGTSMLHVPYKGGAPAKVDLVSGRVSFMFLNPLEVVPQIEAKRLRPLVVGSAERFDLLPDVPTYKELGLPELEARVWWGFMVPAGTPKAVIDVLNAQINQAMRKDVVKEKMKQLGMVAVGGTPEEFGAFLREQVDKWARVVKASNMELK
ncbi:MAG: tripartite tricarboxylate transporter substrate binding protein [Alcaligenaceae bacterium]|nr:tripartite tricarboxylate transporter substrate binding protein [Alcaligenaceae bacterium]